MKCVILCAGYATRLYPLTLNKPKALLPVKGKPLLNYLIEKVDELDIDETFVVTNDKFYSSFLDWKEDFYRNKKIKIINDETFSNEDRLGGLGDLNFVLERGNVDDDFLVLLGDNLFDFSLKEIVDFFKDKNAHVMGLYNVKNLEEAKKFGILEIDSDRKIISFEEKPKNPKSTLISTGIYLFSRGELDKIRDYMKTDLPKEGVGYLVPYFLKSQNVYGFSLDGRWYDIGSRDVYERVR